MALKKFRNEGAPTTAERGGGRKTLIDQTGVKKPTEAFSLYAAS